MSRYIDTHMHLDCCVNHKQLYKQINEAKQYTLCVTNTPEAYERCINTYAETKYIKFALGFNPQSIIDNRFNSYKFMTNISKTRYIGEVGLDFSKPYLNYKEEQIKIFDFICKVAVANNKLMSVHSRQAEEKVLDILRVNNAHKIIMHWYSGNIGLINSFIKQGCYFSVNLRQLVSMKNRELINVIPNDRLLIESDIPFGTYKNINYFRHIEQTYRRIDIDNIDCMIANNFKSLLTQ